jgi:hypothetical protein
MITLTLQTFLVDNSKNRNLRIVDNIEQRIKLPLIISSKFHCNCEEMSHLSSLQGTFLWEEGWG